MDLVTDRVQEEIGKSDENRTKSVTVTSEPDFIITRVHRKTEPRVDRRYDDSFT